MVESLLHGIAGLVAFLLVLALSVWRFKGGERGVASTDLGLD